MAGKVTVLLFVICLIQCLRIERANGEVIGTDELFANTTTSGAGNEAISGGVQKDVTTEVEKELKGFPTPSSALPEMVKKAKEFARQYLSTADLKRLRELVQKSRQNGMETTEIRRLVVTFLNSVLNKTAKHEINKHRAQLQRDFGDAAILS